MNVAIVGYGLEGQESARYWQDLGADITICDKNPDILPEKGVFKTKTGEDYLSDLGSYDLIVRTAGLHPKLIVDANSPDTETKITSSTNEFFRVCPTQNIICVTGTKGKGTTSTLIAKMLEAGGKKVHLGGNIGIPALELLPEVKPDDWVVLELSSFQLIDLRYSPKIAVCLMIVPEHLDWHKDMQEYLLSKANVFKNQVAAGSAVYSENNEFSKQLVKNSPAQKLGYDVPNEGESAKSSKFAHVEGDKILFSTQEICKVSDVKLRGRHNLENICAAINAVWGILDGKVEPIKGVISTFSGLEHRIEFVRELDGVSYFNDSFATTPETSIACMRAFPNQPKVMILGGSDKGIPFEALADEVVGANVRHAVIIGDTAGTISDLLSERGFKNYTLGKKQMSDIVKAAQKEAKVGDVVLLSTGCASFGLFKDYKDRGNQFKKIVNVLV